jgi:hypothetical protein
MSHLVFKMSTLWGGPPGPQPTPSSARRDWMRLISLQKSGSKGTHADQGVCPTTYTCATHTSAGARFKTQSIARCAVSGSSAAKLSSRITRSARCSSARAR